MATTEIWIYGASGHGKVVADIARACGYTVAGWIDDAPRDRTLAWETFCGAYPKAPVALGIGNNAARQAIARKITAGGHPLPVLIHPSAVVSPSATVDEGSVVMPRAVINADATVGAGTIVNTGAVVEHDCILEPFVHLSPAAALAGGVCVKTRAHIGIGASVIQGVTVGEGATIGAGAAVIGSIPDGATAVGVPAKIIKGVL